MDRWRSATCSEVSFDWDFPCGEGGSEGVYHGGTRSAGGRAWEIRGNENGYVTEGALRCEGTVRGGCGELPRCSTRCFARPFLSLREAVCEHSHGCGKR